MINFSIIVPIYPPHFRYLPSLIHQINKFIVSELFSIQEVVIAASQINDTDAISLQDTLKGISMYPLQVVPTLNRCNAAENRNRGWEVAKGNWLIFLDADDIYHPLKLSITAELTTKYPTINGVVHSYEFLKTTDIEKYNISKISEYAIVLPSQIKMHTFPNGYTEPIMARPINPGISYRVPHGILTVRSTFPIKYNKDYRIGEDCIMCRHIVASEGGMLFTNTPLMLYNK